jgi:signal transduction histidine kinase
MNRRIFIQVTAPALLIGLLLLGACLASAWYITRLQKNLANILLQNVKGVQAAQELEITLRQLRFHSFLYMIDPTPAPNDPIKEDHQRFKKALARARELVESPASVPDGEKLVREIEKGFGQYQEDLEKLRTEISRTEPQVVFLEIVSKMRERAARAKGSIDFLKLLDELKGHLLTEVPRREYQKWFVQHPIQKVAEPCQKLLQANQEVMNATFQRSESVSQQGRLVMILIGLIGPIGGLIIGYGMARGLSQSIYRLSVRVNDVAQRLDQDVASVSLAPGGDFQSLDKQLQHVVQKVEEVGERMQRHQREMLRAEQLSAVGQLAAGVAHEVRNPLTSVKILVEAALRSHNRKPLSVEDLEVIHGELARLEQTVQGFLDFARPPTLRRSPVALRDVVAQALELIRVRARQQRVETVVRCGDDVLPVSVDRSQLCNVLVNLFLNALDAMPQGGRLEIDLEASPKAGVRITVADTGAGIPPEIVGRLFTPFASSKPTGTGLGLSISRRIIEEHGGRISGSNRPEGGALFSIILPAPAADSFSREPPASAPPELEAIDVT